MSSEALPDEATPRYEWVNVGRGICMVLVVLLHATDWFERDVANGAAGPWSVISDVLTPLRMPMFFFISGFLAARAVRRPLAATKSRTVGLYYLYVVWTLVVVLRRWVLSAMGQAPPPTVIDIISGLVLPTLFWYIWALAAYFLISKGLIRVLGENNDYVLIPMFALAAAAPLISDWSSTLLQPRTDGIGLGLIAANLVWFYLGVHGKSAWLAIMNTASAAKLVAYTGAYAFVYGAAHAVGVVDELKVILAPLAILAAAQGLALARMNTRVLVIVQEVGMMTLPIYILHFFALSFASTLVSAMGLIPVFQSNMRVSAAIVPPVLTAALMFSSFIAGRLTRGAPARWMLAAPAWITRQKRSQQACKK